MRIVRLRLICHHSFLSTIRSSRKSLRILYHSVLNKGKWKFQHETGEEVQLSMSFFADAYLRHFLLLTHISPFWRTFESNDTPFRHGTVIYLRFTGLVSIPDGL